MNGGGGGVIMDRGKMGHGGILDFLDLNCINSQMIEIGLFVLSKHLSNVYGFHFLIWKFIFQPVAFQRNLLQGV